MLAAVIHTHVDRHLKIITRKFSGVTKTIAHMLTVVKKIIHVHDFVCRNKIVLRSLPLQMSHKGSLPL